ncbi:hypothetical protein CHUAL_001346 [Chamberlinius hualienensis]
MASVEEGSVYNDPNFGVIWSFIEKFGELCGVSPELTITNLQLMLEDTRNVHQDLIDLHIKLLRKSGKKNVPPDKWEKAIVKFCHSYSKVDAWEIERFGYKKSKLSVKLILLKRLLESQFDGNTKFKNEINKMTADELRLLPIGRDIRGKMYWYHQDRDLNLRIYREDQDDETWEIIVKERDDLVALISSLENNASPKKEDTSTPSDTGESKDGEVSLSNSSDAKVLDGCLQFPVATSIKQESNEDNIFVKPEPVDVVSSLKLQSKMKQEDLSFKIEEETVCCQEDLKEIKPDMMQLTIKTEPVDDVEMKEENVDDGKTAPLKSFSNALCRISPNKTDQSQKELWTQTHSTEINEKSQKTVDKSESDVAQPKVRESVIKLAEKFHMADEVATDLTNKLQTSDSENFSATKEKSIEEDLVKVRGQQHEASLVVVLSDDAIDLSTKLSKESVVESEIDVISPQKCLTENSEHAIERRRMPLKKREIPRGYGTKTGDEMSDKSNVNLSSSCFPSSVETVNAELSEKVVVNDEQTKQKKSESEPTKISDVTKITQGENRETTSKKCVLDVEEVEEKDKVTEKSSVVVDSDVLKSVESLSKEAHLDLETDTDIARKETGIEEKVVESDKPVVELKETFSAVKTDENDKEVHEKPPEIEEKVPEKEKTLKEKLSTEEKSDKIENNVTVDRDNISEKLTSEKVEDNLKNDEKPTDVVEEKVNLVEEKTAEVAELEKTVTDSTKIMNEQSKVSVEEKSSNSEIAECLPSTAAVVKSDESKDEKKDTSQLPEADKEESEKKTSVIVDILLSNDSKSSEIAKETTLEDVKSSALKSEILSVVKESKDGKCDKEIEIKEQEISKNVNGSDAKKIVSICKPITKSKSEALETGTKISEANLNVSKSKSDKGESLEMKVEKLQPESETKDLEIKCETIKTPEILDTKPATLKTPEILDTKPATLKTLEILDIKPEALNSKLETLGSKPKTLDTKSAALDKKSAALDAKPEKLEADLYSKPDNSDSSAKTETPESEVKTDIADNKKLESKVIEKSCHATLDKPLPMECDVVSASNATNKKSKGRRTTVAEFSVEDASLNVESTKSADISPKAAEKAKSLSEVVINKTEGSESSAKSKDSSEATDSASLAATVTPPAKAPKKRKRGELANLGIEEVNLVVDDNLPVKRSPRLQAKQLKYEDAQRKIETELQRQALSKAFQKKLKEMRKQNKQAKVENVGDDEDSTVTNGKVPKKRGRPKKKEDKPVQVNKKKGRKRKAKPNQKKRKLVAVGRRKKKNANPWDVSSEESYYSSSGGEGKNGEEEEEEEDDEDEDEELVFNERSDHEFSPESDTEDQNFQPATVKRARTVKKEKTEIESDESSSSEGDDKPCTKCSKRDHPEWMMLVERLHEQLKNFDQLWKKKDRDEMRKKRLAYVGISLDNVLKPEKEVKECSEEEESSEEDDVVQEVKEYVLLRKRSRRARKEVSYRFKEYDELIKSAIDPEPTPIPVIKEPTGLGRGKDMSNISRIEDNGDKEEDKEKEKKDPDEECEDEDDDDDDDDDDDENEQHSAKKRKHRRLNDLATSSEEQDDDSDEDFQESSSNSEEEDSYGPAEDSDESWDGSPSGGRAKSKSSRYEDDYDSDDSFDAGRRKGRRAAAKSVNYREVSDSDDDFGSKRKKARTIFRPFREPHESDDDSDWKRPSKRFQNRFESSAPKPVKRSGNKWRLESDDDEDDSDEDDEAEEKSKTVKKSDTFKGDKSKTRMNVRDFVKRSDDEESAEESDADSEEEEDEEESESGESEGECKKSDDRKSVKKEREVKGEKLNEVDKETNSNSSAFDLTKTNDLSDKSVKDLGKNDSTSDTNSENTNGDNAKQAASGGGKDAGETTSKTDRNKTEFPERLTPIHHPSVLEPYPVRSSPSKLTLLDNYPSRSSPQNKLTPLELYPGSPASSIAPPPPPFDRDRPPRPSHPPPHGAPIPHPHPPPHPVHSHQYHGEYGNYPGQYYPPYPPPPHGSQYSSSPPIGGGYQGAPSGSYPPYQQPSPNYGYVPQAYTEPGLYQGQPPPHYGPPYPNYSPPPPPQVPTQTGSTSQGQSNGRFSIDNLLQRRMEGSEDDEFSSVNELVSYITGSHDTSL